MPQECYDFIQAQDRIAGAALYNHRLSQLTEKVFEPLEDGFDNWYFRYACSWGQTVDPGKMAGLPGLAGGESGL